MRGLQGQSGMLAWLTVGWLAGLAICGIIAGFVG